MSCLVSILTKGNGVSELYQQSTFLPTYLPSFLSLSIVTCGSVMCPESETDIDNDGNLKTQCCNYFSTGCCSPEQNDTNFVL